jgi:hypothetical protein
MAGDQMSVFARRLICILGFLLVLGAPLRAQENLDFGKTPAQLFASDCAICHKSPQGLAAKGGGMLGLENFLREHYTASRESAAAIANYLRTAGSGPAAAPPGRAGKRPPKGDDKAKAIDKKPDTSKPGETKPGDSKSGEGKPGEAKPSAAKPAEPSTAAPKAAEPKPAEPKAAEPKAPEAKPAEGGKSD